MARANVTDAEIPASRRAEELLAGELLTGVAPIEPTAITLP